MPAAAAVSAGLLLASTVLLALEGLNVATGLIYVTMSAAIMGSWRATRSRVLIDADRVLVVNEVSVHQFEWPQVLSLSQQSGLTFEVRTPPYVDFVGSSALGGYSVLSYLLERREMQSGYRQLREFRSGTRTLDTVGRPSPYSTDDLARWSSWRREAVLLASHLVIGLAILVGRSAFA